MEPLKIVIEPLEMYINYYSSDSNVIELSKPIKPLEGLANSILCSVLKRLHDGSGGTGVTIVLSYLSFDCIVVS